MPLKNVDEQLNEQKVNTKKGVYFFDDRNLSEHTKKQDKVASKKLKSGKRIKFSTVFKVDKEELTVTDEELNTEIEKADKVDTAISSLENAKEKVGVQKKNKTKWINLLFFLINIVVLAVVLIHHSKNFGVASLEVFKESTKISFLLYPLLVFALIMIIETLRTHILLYKSTKQVRLALCYKASALSRYYDCITPFATGGQPFEIFYMHSRGVHGGIATSIPLTKAIFNNVAFSIIAVIVLIFNNDLFGAELQTVLVVWSIISLCISCLILIVLILFGISKRFMPKCLMFFLKLGQKLKLVKDYRITFNKLMRTILEYQKSTKYYVTNLWITITSLLCSAVNVLLKSIIPFLLYVAFSETITQSIMLEILCKFILVELATKYIPIPGGTGVAEISFSALFASLFSDGSLFWAMLFWRIMNYFIYLLQGLIILFYDFIYGNKKNRLYKLKQAKLEQELLKSKQKVKKQTNSKKA